MTGLLLRLFVRNADQTDDPKVRGAYGVLSGIVGILCNLLLFTGKLVVGTISGSVSITARNRLNPEKPGGLPDCRKTGG